LVRIPKKEVSMDTKVNQIEKGNANAAEEGLENQKVSRRDFARPVGGAAGATAIGSILAACAPATPKVVEKEVVVVTKEVVVTATPSYIDWEQAIAETRERLSEEELEFVEWLVSEALKDESFAREFASCPGAVFDASGFPLLDIEGAVIEVVDPETGRLLGGCGFYFHAPDCTRCWLMHIPKVV